MKLTADEARNCGIDVPKQNKYRNVKVVVDGIKFDSTKEANRYAELKLMEKAGEIELCVHPSYPYVGEDGNLIFKYVADFWYCNVATGKVTVEDVKPFDKKSQKFRLTPVYRLKKKLIESRFHFKITEV